LQSYQNSQTKTTSATILKPEQPEQLFSNQNNQCNNSQTRTTSATILKPEQPRTTRVFIIKILKPEQPVQQFSNQNNQEQPALLKKLVVLGCSGWF